MLEDLDEGFEGRARLRVLGVEGVLVLVDGFEEQAGAQVGGGQPRSLRPGLGQGAALSARSILSLEARLAVELDLQLVLGPEQRLP